MPRVLSGMNRTRRVAQRAALRMLRRDKQRLQERIRTLETERDEAIAAEQQCRSAVRRLSDTGSSRYVRLLQALDDHPDVDALVSTDDEVIESVRSMVVESALFRGWDACETYSGLKWQRLDDSGSRVHQAPITPAGGLVVGDVLSAAASTSN